MSRCFYERSKPNGTKCVNALYSETIVRKDTCLFALTHISFCIRISSQYSPVLNLNFTLFSFGNVVTTLPPLHTHTLLLKSAEFITSLLICRCGNKKCEPTKRSKLFPDMPLNSDAWMLVGGIFSSWKVNMETWQHYRVVHCMFSDFPHS